VPGDAAFTGLAAQAAQLARREVSSRELVQAALERIDATRQTLNAFRCVRHDAALADAAAADVRLSAGDSAPLLGVPLAVKDDVDVAGESTPFGCDGEFPVAERDAECVRRLRAAGAVIIGKTNTPELGQWPITEGPAFGATRNPWSLDHTPGGSSGGSAAAVAAGLVAGALGSDGLGSIRVPAAWTHLVGIKPQRDRVPTWPDPEPFNGLTVIGPLARSVGDAALLLDAAAGEKRFVAAAARRPPPLHIALSLRAPFAVFPTPLRPDVRAAVERLAGVLQELGHHVETADPAYGVLGIGVLPRAIEGVHGWARKVPDRGRLDPRTLETARLGRYLGGPVLRAARRLEPLMARQVGAIFGRFDAVLAPTTAEPPLPIGALDGLSGFATDRRMLQACPYTWPWNVLGWPGVNVPAGLTDEGLPVGAQLLGPADSEPLLISLAAQLEERERWFECRPPDRVAA
jgi:amidase